MVVVDHDVDGSCQVEAHDERPEEGTQPYGEKRQNCQQSSCEVAVRSEGREARRQIVTDDAREYKYEPEKSKTVQRGNCTLSLDQTHRLEPGQDIHTRA